METVRLACEAMATRFEMVLLGRSAPSLRAAGEEAIAEIHRLETALSLYRSDSQIAALNREAAREPVRVTPEVFHLIRHALELSHATGGAFDITVAPLLRVWGLMSGGGRKPAPEEIEAARRCVGARQVLLDPERCRIAFARPGVMLDLGSLGKGYALDRAADILREAGVHQALLHGGTSTAIGLGADPEGNPWKVAITPPPSLPESGSGERPEIDPAPIAVVTLADESLSVSAVWGKGFVADGQYYGHVLDPRRGEPVRGFLLSAVVLPSAMESDALSTALLVRGPDLLEDLRAGVPALRALLLEEDPHPPGYRVRSSGISATVV